MCRFVGRVAREARVAETACERRAVLSLDIGHERHEEVVEGLEPAAEADDLGERHIALDLEMLGGDLPGGLPSRPEPVGLRGGEPADLAARRGTRQLAALEVRLPVGLDPAEDGVVR